MIDLEEAERVFNDLGGIVPITDQEALKIRLARGVGKNLISEVSCLREELFQETSRLNAADERIKGLRKLAEAREELILILDHLPKCDICREGNLRDKEIEELRTRISRFEKEGV